LGGAAPLGLVIGTDLVVGGLALTCVALTFRKAGPARG
jgi:hypothetical protein